MVEPVFPIPAVGPAHVQVTTTGEWEKASRLADGDEANQFLAGFPDGAPDALGIELVWEGPPISFVGVILDGDRVRTLPELVSELADPQPDPETALIAITGGELGPLATVQCGAINAWSLVPPMTLWDGTTWREPAIDLPAHPVLRACAYPVGLEVGHQHAWYAVEVSHRTNSLHIVDETRLADLTHAVRQQLP